MFDGRYILLFLLYVNIHCDENICHKDIDNCNLNKRYLFYDINFSEGFNLRRDVYMRFAVLVNKMKNSADPLLNNFHLVLPPWSHLVHWKLSHNPEHIPWGMYFDIKSLRMFAPVIEMHEFFNEYPNKYSKVIIDKVYTLQHFEDMFETGNFEDRMKVEKCQKEYDHLFFYFNNITTKSYNCLSYHGPATKLKELFLNSTAQSFLIEHAEVALHEHFGSKLYWKVRRSMRFSQNLKTIAAEFRKNFLSSRDEEDNTILPQDWVTEKPHRNAKGGPYLAVHLRRRDFVRHRPNEAPSLYTIAQQTMEILKQLHLNRVFVATDGSPEEYKEFSNLLDPHNVFRYVPTEIVQSKYGDGGVAIIDQIICSHARYFIGTHESTFSFRIQEEREILGFPMKTTFNVFCSSDNKCPKPSLWKIVY